MKNNLLIMMIAALSMCLFSACQNDVDVMETCDNITLKSMHGEHSLCQLNGLKFTVTEYQLSDDGGVYVQRTFADGQKSSVKSYKFSYVLGDYLNDHATRIINADAGENGQFELIWSNGVIADQENNLYEAKSVEKNFETVVENLPNTTWEYFDNELWIDTTTLDSLHYYKKNVRDTVYDPATGEPLKNSQGKDSFVIVLKDFVDTVYYDVYDTVGNKMTLDIKLVLNKDSKHNNNGSYLYDYKEYNYDLSVSKDSVVQNDFKWGFASVTSAKKFELKAVNTQHNDTTILKISNFDIKKKVLTFEDREMKLK